MHIGMVVLIILVALLAVLVSALLYRLAVLRRGGTAAILRTSTDPGGAGWRHGVFRYGDETLAFYKLSSLRPGPDYRISRQGVEVGERRRPREGESDIMSDDVVVLSVDDVGRTCEVALGRGALTGFLSWVESRPSGRSMRGRSS